MSAMRRPFRIEGAMGVESRRDPMDISPLEGQLARIFDELVQVRGEIERFKSRDPAVDRERDRNVLWTGIETIQDAIRNTKLEIATLHAEGPRGERLLRATSELEAVVTDTEQATETILSSAELIESLTKSLLKRLEGEDLEYARAIQAEVVKTFEACNFQDITGQRIRKVVKLLVFIEERVTRMTDIWGGAELVAQAAGIMQREGDEALLNGPALASDIDVVSQDDIDSLFR